MFTMKSSLRNILLSGIVALSLVTVPAIHAQDAKTNGTEVAKVKNNHIPFHGVVTAVDTKAMTINIGDRVLVRDSESKLMVDGKDATLSEVKAGLYAHGTWRKDGEKQIIISCKFDKEAPAKKAKATSVSTNGVASATADATMPPEAPKKKHKKKDASGASTNTPPQ